MSDSPIQHVILADSDDPGAPPSKVLRIAYTTPGAGFPEPIVHIAGCEYDETTTDATTSALVECGVYLDDLLAVINLLAGQTVVQRIHPADLRP